MNKERREDLCEVIGILDEATDFLNEICDREQEAYDNLSEGLQYSSTGDSMMAAVDEMGAISAEIESTKKRIFLLAKPPKKAKKTQ